MLNKSKRILLCFAQFMELEIARKNRNKIDSTSLNLLYFADDTTVYKSGPHIDNINQEFKHSCDYLCANKLALNVKKTNVCIFIPPNNKYQVNNYQNKQLKCQSYWKG